MKPRSAGEGDSTEHLSLNEQGLWIFRQSKNCIESHHAPIPLLLAVTSPSAPEVMNTQAAFDADSFGVLVLLRRLFACQYPIYVGNERSSVPRRFLLINLHSSVEPDHGLDTGARQTTTRLYVHPSYPKSFGHNTQTPSRWSGDIPSARDNSSTCSHQPAHDGIKGGTRRRSAPQLEQRSTTTRL